VSVCGLRTEAIAAAAHGGVAFAFEQAALQEAGEDGVGDAGAALGVPVVVDLGGGGMALASDEIEDGFFAGQFEFLIVTSGAIVAGMGGGRDMSGRAGGHRLELCQGFFDPSEHLIDLVDRLRMLLAIGLQLADFLGQIGLGSVLGHRSRFPFPEDLVVGWLHNVVRPNVFVNK